MSNKEKHFKKSYLPQSLMPVRYLFKENPSKPGLVNPTETFITDHSINQYCSLFSTREDNLPKYLEPLSTFLDNVLDIPSEKFAEISKLHMEREGKFKEEEKKEEERLLKIEENEMKIKNSLDREVTKFLSRSRKYVKRPCPVKIPFKTTLTSEEHEFYVKCFIKYQMRAPSNSIEQNEYDQYLSLQNKVFDEQSCMMNFSYKVAQLNMKQYNSVLDPIESYINTYFSHRCQRVSLYPKYYKNEIGIPLKPLEYGNKAETFQFNYIGNLLSLGSIPWLTFPESHIAITLPKDDTVANLHPPDGDDNFDKEKFIYKCPVSEDPNAKFLAETYGASVVMSASAFKTLVDNQEQPFDKEWNIPIRIKPAKRKDESGKEIDMRIIYFDKAFPKKSWLPLQKKQTFFKASAKAKLAHWEKHHCFRMRQFPKTVKQFRKKTHKFGNRDSYLSGTEDNSVDGFEANEAYFSRSNTFTRKFESTPSSPSSNTLSPSHSIVESDLFLSEDEDTNDSTKSNAESLFSQPCSSTNMQPCLKDKDLSEHHQNKMNSSQNNNEKSSLNKRETLSASDLASSTINHNLSSSENNKRKRESSSSLEDGSGLLDELINKQDAFLSSNTTKVSDNASRKELVDHNVDNICTKSKKFKRETDSVENVENSDKHTGLLDNILNTQTSFLKTKGCAGTETLGNISKYLSPEKGEGNGGAKKRVNLLTVKPWSNTLDTEWKNYEPKLCPKASGTNVHYQLFSFEKSDQGPVKNDRSDAIRILVRHNVHGLSRMNLPKKRSSEAYVIYPKLENQVYFGCEVNSLSEIAQQWATLVIRPNTKLLQIRLCVENGNIIMTDEKNLESILKDGKQSHVNFNPQTVFSTLNVLFNTLLKMGSGDYLLHHDAKTGAFMNLMKAVDSESATFSTNSVDLHKMYSDSKVVSLNYKSPPWVALDTHILTPFHLVHKKIPATFPMQNLKILSSDEKKRRKKNALSKMRIEGYE